MRSTAVLLFLFLSCNSISQNPVLSASVHDEHYTDIASIPLPAGYQRMEQPENSFGIWLRSLRIKNDKKVHLYNGNLKSNQSAQFVVLDVPVGHKDLQQCADAVMRLRAEYFFSRKEYDRIVFSDNEGRMYRWNGGSNRKEFESYLEKVFAWCGTLSLQKSMKPVLFSSIQPGDVFIRGGSPGHAMIVTDVAIDSAGHKIFMLAQSYMPAQEIHIVKNPLKNNDPWFEVSDANQLQTPEWTFKTTELRRWEN